MSDAGPLIHLAQINKLQILEKLFKRVLISQGVKREVVDEGIKLGHSDAVTVKEAIDKGWIMIEKLTREELLAAKRLAKGENISQSDAETLILAKKKEARNVLVDEKILSHLAKMFGFTVWNTWTIMLEALSKRLIEISDIKLAIKELGEHRHKLKAKQAEEILEAAERIVSNRK